MDRPGASNATEARTREEGPVVCTANTCRSPTAQAIFDTLTEDEGLPFRAESAATEALKGTAIAYNAVAAMEEAEIYPVLHSARW